MKLIDAITVTTLEAARQPVQKQYPAHTVESIPPQQTVIHRLTLWSRLHSLLSHIFVLRKDGLSKSSDADKYCIPKY